MSVSMNGRTIIPSAPSPLLQTCTVALYPTGSLSTQLAAGDAAVVLTEVARRFNAEVEPLQTFYGWRSLATNTASGGIANSNHLSGTAVDLNGAWHLRFRKGTFSAAQVAAIRQILADLPGVRWGGDYPTYEVDEMHFEIVGAASVVSATANRISTTGRSLPTAPGDLTATAPEDDMPTAKEVVDELLGRLIDVNSAGLASVPVGQLLADIAVSARNGSPESVWAKAIDGGASAEARLVAIQTLAGYAVAESTKAAAQVGGTVDVAPLLDAIHALPQETVAAIKAAL